MTSKQANLNPDKLELIDYVFQRCQPAPVSTADLGGVWGVNGGYTLYAASKHRTSRSVLVDTGPNEECMMQLRRYPAIQFYEGNFGDPSIRDRVGQVDVIFLFDVLLHQVKPDWDQILSMYAGNARYLLIFNQQWTATEDTVRLLDLGETEYFRNVPHSKDEPEYAHLFGHMHEMSERFGKIWRDAHNVWQWGITDKDLVKTLRGLGYRLLLYKNCGRFGMLPNCENHSFVFKRGA